MHRLTSEVLSKNNSDVSFLQDDIIRSMYDLYFQYYDGTSYSLFSADLSNKDYAILLRDEHHILRGFSTLAVLEFAFAERQKRAIFSGDTIVHHEYWGEQTLSLTWCRLAGTIKRDKPDLPLYWFLIVKGYRTYRYLPVFARQFYPNWRYPTPDEYKALMDYLGRSRFGEYYDPDSGLVKFPTSQGHLRETWADIKPEMRKKPDVKYFLTRNPEYDRGHELVCLMELRADNMRSHARRGFLEGLNL
ncbi:MAG: hypothetical protein AB4352_04150 [Hormoscilla sp.]